MNQTRRKSNCDSVRKNSSSARQLRSIMSGTEPSFPEQSIQCGNTRTSRLGVVYLSFGEKYKRLTELSASFLRAFGYVGPIRVVTASSGWKIDHLDCEIVKVPFRGLGFATRYYKTQINQYAFDTTLFMDADTVPVASIRSVWRELRFADICISRDLHPRVLDQIKDHFGDQERRHKEYFYMADLGLLQHPLYNSGVMLFRRNPATDKLFEAWHEEWQLFRQEDQQALVRAIARTGTAVHPLANRWNAWQTRFESLPQAQNSGVRILHTRPENILMERAWNSATAALELQFRAKTYPH